MTELPQIPYRLLSLPQTTSAAFALHFVFKITSSIMSLLFIICFLLILLKSAVSIAASRGLSALFLEMAVLGRGLMLLFPFLWIGMVLSVSYPLFYDFLLLVLRFGSLFLLRVVLGLPRSGLLFLC